MNVLQPSTLQWTRPDAFYYLLLIIPLAALLFFNYKRRFSVISAFISGGVGGGKKQLPLLARKLRLRYLFSSLFFLMFIAAVIAAFAGPRAGIRLVREFRRGCDVIFAVDISRSMLARDCLPLPTAQSGANNPSSRLERAVWIARSLVAASEDPAIMAQLAGKRLASGGAQIHLRLGVSFGKGEAVLAVPLTHDTEAIRVLLDALSVETMSSRGTNLENIIDSAAKGFLENTPAGRVIILLSDGEGLSGSPSQAVERAKQRDITVIAVGIGSQAGVLVPENGIAPTGAPSNASSGSASGITLSGGPDSEKKDFVRSYLHEDIMRSAVERADGAYIDGNNNEALRGIAEKIFPLAGASSWILREESGSQWHICVIAALIFLSLCAACNLRIR